MAHGGKTSNVIRFPGRRTNQAPRSGRKKKIVLASSMDFDKELDRALEELGGAEDLLEGMLHGSSPQAFFNALRLLRQKPKEIVVFCNTILQGIHDSAPWGDVFGLTDPPDTYRYLFTLYSKTYVRDCHADRGEVISPSSENVILPTSSLTSEHVVRGALKWINQYYPALKGIEVRLEDPTVVQEMISSTFLEE